MSYARTTSQLPSAEILKWRESLRLTREEAARALGLSAETYTKYEKGLNPIPLYVPLACLAILHNLTWTGSALPSQALTTVPMLPLAPSPETFYLPPSHAHDPKPVFQPYEPTEEDKKACLATKKLETKHMAKMRLRAERKYEKEIDAWERRRRNRELKAMERAEIKMFSMAWKGTR